jgi:hypothetical protein
MTRVALFNDTGRYPHVGCRGVSSGHDRMLARLGVEVAYRSFHGDWRELWQGDRERSLDAFRRSPLAAELRRVDAVVVNGEGTIHHEGGRHLVAVLAGAQDLGLPTFLVNAVFQESEEDLVTLTRLRDFTVRDAASSAYLGRLDVAHRVVFDSILEADFVDEPAWDLGGRIAITDWHSSRDADVGVALETLRRDLGDNAVSYPLEDAARADRWRHAVADLRTARLVVTARHHGVCLAGLAGVPLVAMGSNTWKIEGMLALLPGNLQVVARLEELPDACLAALGQPALFEEIRECLRAARPLSTFAGLAALAPR